MPIQDQTRAKPPASIQSRWTPSFTFVPSTRHWMTCRDSPPSSAPKQPTNTGFPRWDAVQSIQLVWDSTEPIFQTPMSEAQADFEDEFHICAWAKTLQSVHVYSYCSSSGRFRNALLSTGTRQLPAESRELEGSNCCRPAERTRNARVLRAGVAMADSIVFH